MVERLWDLALDSTPLHVKVYKSMFRDPDANVTDSLQAEYVWLCRGCNCVCVVHRITCTVVLSRGATDS